MQQQIELLVQNIEQVIVGKRSVIVKVLAALLAKGHVLIEDVPGVGKTQLVAAMSHSLNGKFNRIQMTPDVMPSDVIGYTMIHPETRQLTYQRGAAICNFLLADEINRASPKAQSSLLEIMEENQISLEGQTFPLPKPFMTLATQNPVETYGTYHLPEAQMDRFMMRISIGYPDKSDELKILSEVDQDNPAKNLTPVLDLDDVVQMQEAVSNIGVHPLVQEYIWQIVNATRHNANIQLGVSPRGSLALQKAARAVAFIQQRDFVTPDDVREVAPSVLAHRIMLSPKGKNGFPSQEAVMESVLGQVPVPVPQT